MVQNKMWMASPSHSEAEPTRSSGIARSSTETVKMVAHLRSGLRRDTTPQRGTVPVLRKASVKTATSADRSNGGKLTINIENDDRAPSPNGAQSQRSPKKEPPLRIPQPSLWAAAIGYGVPGVLIILLVFVMIVRNQTPLTVSQANGVTAALVDDTRHQAETISNSSIGSVTSKDARIASVAESLAACSNNSNPLWNTHRGVMEAGCEMHKHAALRNTGGVGAEKIDEFLAFLKECFSNPAVMRQSNASKVCQEVLNGMAKIIVNDGQQQPPPETAAVALSPSRDPLRIDKITRPASSKETAETAAAALSPGSDALRSDEVIRPSTSEKRVKYFGDENGIVPTPQEYVAQIGSDASIIPPGALKLDGQSTVCGQRPTVLNSKLDDYSAAYPGFIILNPRLLARITTSAKMWVYAHACGFQFRGPDPAVADCFATQRGRRQGWLTPQGVDEVCNFIKPSKGDEQHMSGPHRCEDIRRCYADPFNR